ncbi:MAG: GH3 auxin-responsive promoter family protein [Phycisphaerae bacterium]|nr:GH3 auxin-responsive promoter family protein [Phycisphaerae bacterium]
MNALIRAAAAVGRWQALRHLAAFRRGLARAANVQDRLLTELLAGSVDSRFGADFGLRDIRGYADFAARMPLVGYDRIAPYIEPIKRGDVTGLFNPGTKVHMLALTSGTTGAVKYLPVTDRYLANYRRAWNAWGIALYDSHPAAWLRPILQIASPMDEERTESGIPCGAISGFIFQTQKKIVQKFYVLPACVGYIKSGEAKCYTIMRLAVGGDVGMMATANPSTSLQLVQTAERCAGQLIRDIRDGTLRADLDVPAEIRAELAPRLTPDPVAANRLDSLASTHGRLLPKHYWSLGFMTNWMGGTLGLYLRQFPEYFGDTPIRDLGLVASEGRMSVPLEDNTAAGVLEIYGTFYEFLPVDQADSPRPDMLRCHELTVGGEYFIVLTTAGGLFRYHIGDVIRCEGFMGQAPIISFLNKGKHVSSITGEKLTEHQVVIAAERIAASLSVSLGDFVLCPRWAAVPFYALNVEQSRCPADQFAALAAAFDAELGLANVEYRQKRDSGRLGPITVAHVPDGFFDRLAEQRLRERRVARREQYKHQYLYVTVDGDKDFPR